MQSQQRAVPCWLPRAGALTVALAALLAAPAAPAPSLPTPWLVPSTSCTSPELRLLPAAGETTIAFNLSVVPRDVFSRADRLAAGVPLSSWPWTPLVATRAPGAAASAPLVAPLPRLISRRQYALQLPGLSTNRVYTFFAPYCPAGEANAPSSGVASCPASLSATAPSDALLFTGDLGSSVATEAVLSSLLQRLQAAGAAQPDDPRRVADRCRLEASSLTNVLLLGDTAYAYTDASKWSDYVNLAAPLLLRRAVVGNIPGNHDVSPAVDWGTYTALFGAPASGGSRRAAAALRGSGSGGTAYQYAAAPPRELAAGSVTPTPSSTNTPSSTATPSPSLDAAAALANFCDVTLPARARPGVYYAYSPSPRLAVIALCPGCDGGLRAGDAQHAFLLDALACASAPARREAAPFLVVAMHEPLYTSNTNHWNAGASLAALLEPAFLAAGVDVVLSGHVHAFEVTAPAAGNTTNPAGPVHVIAGVGGNPWGLDKTWVSPRPAWTGPVPGAADPLGFGYGELRVLNTTHLRLGLYVVVDEDGNPAADPDAPFFTQDIATHYTPAVATRSATPAAASVSTAPQVPALTTSPPGSPVPSPSSSPASRSPSAAATVAAAATPSASPAGSPGANNNGPAAASTPPPSLPSRSPTPTRTRGTAASPSRTPSPSPALGGAATSDWAMPEDVGVSTPLVVGAVAVSLGAAAVVVCLQARKRRHGGSAGSSSGSGGGLRFPSRRRGGGSGAGDRARLEDDDEGGGMGADGDSPQQAPAPRRAAGTPAYDDAVFGIEDDDDDDDVFGGGLGSPVAASPAPAARSPAKRGGKPGAPAPAAVASSSSAASDAGFLKPSAARGADSLTAAALKKKGATALAPPAPPAPAPAADNPFDFPAFTPAPAALAPSVGFDDFEPFAAPAVAARPAAPVANALAPPRAPPSRAAAPPPATPSIFDAMDDDFDVDFSAAGR